jgi:glycosyltransferase involved in cell wall biosynthesis
VAIASYNRRERLLEVLGGLGAQSFPAERYEVVVVLDGSTDGSAEALSALEVPYRLRVIEQDNRGLAASRNRGGEEAGAPVVVFLDDDIVPEPAFLAEHADAHRDGGTDHVALGTCPPARSEGDLITLALRNWWEDYYRRRGEPDHPWTYVDFGDGNVSIPRELLLRTGGWDEDFTRGGARRQDWEYGIRLLQAGVRFSHRAEARGLHHFDARLPTALRNRRAEGHSDVLLGRKHPHVRGHLNLARFVRTPRERWLSRRFFAFTYDHPAASERVVRSTLPLARGLERAQLRDRWWSLVNKLLSHAYLLGVRDALPTQEAFQEFVAPIEDGRAVTRIPLALDRPDRLEIPPGAGAVALELSYRGRSLAEVQAIELEEQLDWERLTQRVVGEVPAPFDDVLAVSEEAPGQ